MLLEDDAPLGGHVDHAVVAGDQHHHVIVQYFTQTPQEGIDSAQLLPPGVVGDPQGVPGVVQHPLVDVDQ